MSCLPSSTKCEWRDLSHFVKKYNSKNSETFDRTRCQDVEDRSSKQPEVLCTNKSNDTLVIERKSLLWPLDYAKLHSAEHRLWSLLFEKFNGKLDGNFTIHAGSISEVSDTSIENLANEILSHSLPKATCLRPGQGFTIPVSISLSIRREYDNERDFDEPQSGLRILSSEMSCSELSDPNDVPGEFVTSVKKMLQSASVKMSQYTNSRKILILNYSNGTMFCTCNADWWRIYLTVYEIPPYSFDELWLSFNYENECWAFEQVWP